MSYDPQSGGFVVVKETQPLGVFQTGVDFAAGTATNGSPTTENSVNLFDPRSRACRISRTSTRSPMGTC